MATQEETGMEVMETEVSEMETVTVTMVMAMVIKVLQATVVAITMVKTPTTVAREIVATVKVVEILEETDNGVLLLPAISMAIKTAPIV
jgi:aspartate aminotransferase-like enzyme